MKKAKRALALALVFALVASFCVTGAAAAPGDGPVPGNDETYVQNGGPATQDGVIVSKTAEYVGKNEYEITLEVTIPDNATVAGTDTDVVLVIDSSGSMGRGGMSDAKEAAQNFANELFNATDVDIRVAIVDYDDDATVVQVNGASWLTNSDQVDSALDRISDGGGTHIQGGIYEARELLASSDNKKVMIVISDGEPTYSFRPTSVSGTITECYYTWFGFGDHTIAGASVDGKSLEFDGFVYNYQSYWNHNRNGGTLGDGSEPNASWDISWTCEHEGQSGTDKFWYSHAWPTIAEAGFAKADNVEIYSVYIGSLSGNAQTTMEGIASGTDHCASTEGTSLSALLEEIAGSVTSTTAGAVSDPMGKNITLGDVENLAGAGVSVSDDRRTLYWNPTNGRENEDGSTTYTVTYPITVDGEKLTASGWVYANDTTTFTYEVNGEERTAEFNVPKVWGEKVVTPPQGTPQDVYVYVEVVKDDGNEFSEDEIAKLGLAAINEHGYYTIGVVNNVTMPDLNSTDTSNIYDEYGSGVTNKINNGEITRYAPNAGCDLSKVKWYSLHKVTNGADDYPVTGNCWHLDGRIRISDIEEVTVTYTSGYDNTTLATYDTIKGAYTPTISSEPTRNGYTFTGWKKVVDGEPSGDILSSEDIAGTPLTEDTTYVAQWRQNTSEVYIKVYLDDEDVTAQYNTYLSGLTTTGTTSGIGKIEYRDGHVVVPYAYEDIDSADVTFGVNSDYVLQGIEGTFIKGETAWTGITPSDDGWNIDNVMGGTTLSVYLNTKYSVEYVVPDGFEAPPDNYTYITVKKITNDNSNDPVIGQDGEERSWANDDAAIKTEITIATLPQGTNGWTDEANGSKTEGDKITVSEAVADGLNGIDNTFTFSATANEYTVTYHANTSAEDTNSYTDPNTVTHGGSYTVLGIDAVNTAAGGDFANTGYTFAGWTYDSAGQQPVTSPITVTDNVNLYAQWKEITGTLTVTKTFTGLDEGVLPSDFSITVTGPDGSSQTLTLNGKTPVDGVYTWEIKDAPYGEYTIRETNTTVYGYTLQESSVTTAEAEINDESGDTAELKNVYVKDNPGLGVEKTVYSVNSTVGAAAEVRR